MRVERFVVAEDCGRLINPLIVDGQVHGGVAQGIGAALYEEVVYDDRGPAPHREPGRLSGAVGLRDSADAGRAPRNASPTTLGGFRGMGEGGTIGAPAAVANAVADALAPLGIEINELPVTPERLFRLIEAARAAGKR